MPKNILVLLRKKQVNATTEMVEIGCFGDLGNCYFVIRDKSTQNWRLQNNQLWWIPSYFCSYSLISKRVVFWHCFA